MDPYTERLLERTRQRREELEKKMIQGSSPSRKRSSPLTLSHRENLNDQNITDDSPQKRQCLRETERQLKPDTPAVPSVKSRLQQVGSSWRPRVDDSENADGVSADAGTRAVTAIEASLDDNTTRKPASRKNRFAALAQNFNDYEDDLSQHSFEPKEPPKKVWVRPGAAETPKNNSGPTKPPRRSLAVPKSPEKREVSPIKKRETSPVKKREVSPTKKWEASPRKENMEVSPRKKFEASPTKRSEIKVMMGRTEDVGEVKLTIVPGRTTICSPSVNAIRVTPDEPTATPVSARLAAWRETTDERAMSTPVSATMASWQKKIDKENSNAKKAVLGTPAKMHSLAGKCSPVTKGNDFKEAMARRANAVDQYTTTASPQKTTSSVASPSKVGTATQSIHDRLEHLQGSWQGNEIAVKLQQQKRAELAQLENRWKDGVLIDDKTNAASDSARAPPPPPALPTPSPASTRADAKVLSPKKAWSPVKAPGVKASPAKRASPMKKAPVSEKRVDARNKLRNEDIAEGQCDNSRPSQTITDIPNFEDKLKNMGFEVAGSSHTATIDLKEQRRRDKAEAETKASSQPSGKTATAQLHLVQVEDSRRVVTTFSDEKVTEKKTTTSTVFVKPKAVAAPKAATPSSGTPVRSSIYNLIKKPPVGKTITPEVYTRSRPVETTTKRRDSFDSDESSFTEEPPRRLGAAGSQDSVDDGETSSSGVERQSSFTSTQSGYSESQSSCSEAPTDDYTTQTEYTEEDESYTDDDMESYSDESRGGDVSDLLEQALDDNDEYETTDTEPVVEPVAAPRPSRAVGGQPSDQQRANSSGYPPAAGQRRERPTSQPVNMRTQPVVQEPSKRVTFAGPQSTTSGTSSGSGSCTDSSTESEAEKRRTVYSITKYRTKNAPTMTIVRHSEHQGQSQRQEELPYIPEVSVKERLRELHELVTQEQNIVSQTSNALNQCCGTNSTFAGSTEAVECHRLLLISCKKREAYLAEMAQLKQGTPQPRTGGPNGSLTITDISLPLKQEFMSRIGTNRDTAAHYFIILVRNGNHLVFTQMVSTHDAMVRGSLDFPNMIKMSDIRQNFKVNLEIYSMSVTREVVGENTPKKKKFNTPKKKFFSSVKSGHHIGMQSPGGPRAVRSTNFHEIACLPITVHALNKGHFALERMPMSSPLQGSIHLRLTCLMENSIEERGFLTMFEDVCGFGAWHRRWCALSNHTLSFWKYPDDENKKEPIGVIDLKQCITDVVGLIPRDVCARPNTFELRMVRRQLRGEADTLVTHCNNTLSTTRHWMSADTKADRFAWCDTLNQALHNIRMWHADALRPIKSKSLVCS